MGKMPNTKRYAENEAIASNLTLRVSPRKLGLVAGAIRGKKASDALTFLNFDKKRISKDVKKVLMSAICNAENNHGLDIDKLVVAEALVGKAITMKRIQARAKGRAGRILKPFSRLSIRVRETQGESR